MVKVKSEFLLHTDQLDAPKDVCDLVLQVIVRHLPRPIVGRLVLQQSRVEQLGEQDVDGGETHLVLGIHIRLVAGVLEKQLDNVLLGVEAGGVEGRGQELLVDMSSTGASLPVSLCHWMRMKIELSQPQHISSHPIPSNLKAGLDKRSGVKVILINGQMQNGLVADLHKSFKEFSNSWQPPSHSARPDCSRPPEQLPERPRTRAAHCPPDTGPTQTGGKLIR